MRLLKCSVSNFGSYQSLEIDFSNVGLGLIYGKTGSGKSTIPDMACWALFGVTAKDGAVDEVRSWQSPGEPTKATLEVELPTGQITVVRIRGKATQNDLYYIEEATPDTLCRGKDINDTQQKLNKRLGVDADSYISGSYFHEFSHSGSFFTSKAKDRRELFEGIASLELPVKLGHASAGERKLAKDRLTKQLSRRDVLLGRLDSLRDQSISSLASERSWAEKQAAYVQTLIKRSETFEADKEAQISKCLKEIKELQDKVLDHGEFRALLGDLRGELKRLSTEKCKECGGPKAGHGCDAIRDQISGLEKAEYKNNSLLQTIDGLVDKATSLQAAANTLVVQITEEASKVNPFIGQLLKVEQDIEATTRQLQELKGQLQELEHRVTSLTQLYDLSFDLSGELLKKAVRGIETSTNAILERHFDAEISVGFTIESDNLEVSIQKSGYDCVYRQLSKGQRQLLKLAFVVSIMRASANRAGVHFSNLFMDEALDGLDSDLKVKAFSLFSELETQHESILVIDHSPDLQNMFSKKYHVSMTSDYSELSLEES